MSLGNTILKYRKELGITQESLARQLEVTNQAVSKWESDQCCPDVLLLPRLADIFGITLDELFGRKAPEKTAQVVAELPWPDDGNLRGVLYLGWKLIGHETGPKRGVLNLGRKLIGHGTGPEFKLSFQEKVEGNVYSDFSVVCGDVTGSVDAGTYVQCGNVGGKVDAGTYVQCGNVTGDVDAGQDVRCGTVEGDVDTGHSVFCGDVMGDVNAGLSVQCGNVGGDIDAGGGVTIKK